MSIEQPRMREMLAHVRGLGSARGGTHHWWIQRVTAIALALLTPWFFWLAVSLAGADHASTRAVLAQPLHATLMLAWVISMFWHAKLGVQVVLEDYVHTPWLEYTAQILVNFACVLGALASIVAIGRLVFTA